ncbi:MAG: hypothetical protein LBU97_01130 [Alistipes sp.]|nr:hypothetical protein [Alistipes sp.]
MIDIQNDITKNYREVIGNINAAIAWAGLPGECFGRLRDELRQTQDRRNVALLRKQRVQNNWS